MYCNEMIEKYETTADQMSSANSMVKPCLVCKSEVNSLTNYNDIFVYEDIAAKKLKFST